MKTPTPAAYQERLAPYYARLFRTAHAIVGNLDIASYVLRNAIVEAYLRYGEWQRRMGFEEGLMHTVREIALFELKGIRAAGAYETDWVFPTPSADLTAAQSALYARLLRESALMQRIAMLSFGCGLSARQTAVALRMRPQEVSSRLRRLCARLARTLRGGRGALYAQMEALTLAALDAPGADLAGMGSLFRSFERDIANARKPGITPVRAIATALRVLLAVVLAAAVWLAAVLLEPQRAAPADTPAVQAETVPEGPTQSVQESPIYAHPSHTF